MWTPISTETAQFLFDSSVDFQYRVCEGVGPSFDDWDDYFSDGKDCEDYISPEMLALDYPKLEFRAEAE